MCLVSKTFNGGMLATLPRSHPCGHAFNCSCQGGKPKEILVDAESVATGLNFMSLWQRTPQVLIKLQVFEFL